MYTYIKKNVNGFYVELLEKLTSDLFSDLGETYEDFTQNKWVLLSEEQVKFHEENPSATIQEVWNMQFTPKHVRDLVDAKREMLNKISNYDISENVNGFTINHTMVAWFSVQERLNYKQSIESAKLLGIDKLSFFVGDAMLEISPAMAEQMLAALQLYADSCYIVTKQHQLTVQKLETIEDVDNYDYKSGYPTRLNFDLE